MPTVPYAATAPWTGILGKPDTFPSDPHSTPLSSLTASGANAGDLVVWNGTGFVTEAPAAASTAAIGVTSISAASANQLLVSGSTGPVKLTIPAVFIVPGSLETTTTLKVDDATAATSTSAACAVFAGGLGVAKTSFFGGVIVHKNYTVSTLPAASSSTYGIAFVSDSTSAPTAGVGAAPTGGGTNIRAVYSNGSAWLQL